MSAPERCVCGERNASLWAGGTFGVTHREFACGSAWRVMTGWHRACLAAFHQAAALRQREAALVAALKELTLQMHYHGLTNMGVPIPLADAYDQALIALALTEPVPAPPAASVKQRQSGAAPAEHARGSDSDDPA